MSGFEEFAERRLKPAITKLGIQRETTIAFALAGVSSIPFMGLYSASKFALEGYTQALRMEISPFNIHISLAEPAFLKTPMADHRQASTVQLRNTTHGGNVPSKLFVILSRRRLDRSRWQNRYSTSSEVKDRDCTT